MAALKKAAFMAKVMALDAGCTFLNLITPNRKPGSVTPHGSLGADGKWPEFVPAREGDSRCSCPALNAMANHGEPILCTSPICSWLTLASTDRYLTP